VTAMILCIIIFFFISNERVGACFESCYAFGQF